MSTGSMGPHNLDGPMDPFDLLDLFVLCHLLFREMLEAWSLSAEA